MLVHVKSDLTYIHVVRLSEVADRRVDDIHLIQFTSFDTVRFHQLTAVVQRVGRNVVNRLTLRANVPVFSAKRQHALLLPYAVEGRRVPTRAC